MGPELIERAARLREGLRAAGGLAAVDQFVATQRGLTRADLAARMGVSPGRVSQILGGGENLTLRTLAALSTALDARFDIALNVLKADDAYTSRSPGSAELAAPRQPR